MSETDLENRVQFVDCSILPNFSYELQNRLVRLLHELFNERPELIDLKTTISFNKIGTRGIRRNLGVLFFSNESGISDSIRYSDYHSLVYFSDFQLRNISDRTIFVNSDSKNLWTQIYNPYWNRHLASRRYGINVLKKISMKGYLLNFNDVRNLIDECVGSPMENILDYINEFYYISNRNILIGIVTTTGNLILRLQAIKKVLEYNDDETVKKCFLNIFTCFLKTLKLFNEMNIRSVQEHISGILEQGAWNRVVNAETLPRRIRHMYPERPDEIISELKQDISKFITASLDVAFRHRIFGVHDKYSYAKILNKILEDNIYKEKEKFKEGFKKGIRFGLKFEMEGWEPCNPNFFDNYRNTDMWWKKDVNIHPSTFIYKGERYSIPEKYRNKFHITALYINQNGRMRAIGNHPNVSGSSVCMGDLKIDFTDETINLKDYLVQAEELLDMINYDSSYRNDSLTEFLKVSEKQDSLFSTYNDKIPVTSTIRELDFDVNDDDEEEEEEEVIQRVLVQNERGELLEDVEFIVENGGHMHHMYSDEKAIGDTLNQINISIEENRQSSDVYQLDESIVINDISHVDQDGNIIRVVEPLHESFSLGDSNLVGAVNE